MQIDVALLELGAIMLALALISRVAARLSLPAIPFYLAASFFFGEGGLISITEAKDFIDIGASLGVIFLLFMLGLEYSPRELRQSLSDNRIAGLIDFALNTIPGVVLGVALGWGALGSIMLGGITYVSSSGIVARVLVDLERLGNRETPTVLSVLVIEDLVMAIFLPVVAVLLAGDSLVSGAISGSVALAIVVFVIFLPASIAHRFARAIDIESDDILLITLLGVALVVAGLAERFHISYAIGAFLVGILLSGEVAERARPLLTPLRDSFSAVFFVSFGLAVDAKDLLQFIPVAGALALIGAASKFGTGYWSSRRVGTSPRAARRAGVALIPRGEFSIVLAGIAIAGGVNSDLGPIVVTYVLLTAIGGSLATRFVN